MEQEINPIQNPNPIDPQLPQKRLNPGIWIAILIVAASSIGYLVWANVSKEWPFRILPIPDKPSLVFAAGTNPYIQITWNYDIAESFNIYRSTAPNTGWEKVISNYPSSAHAAVDYDYPKNAGILYYRIIALDKSGNEGNASPISSVVLQEETANWQTYTNTLYGFEFKHPSDHTPFASIDGTKEKLISATPTSERVNIAERSDANFQFGTETIAIGITIGREKITARQWYEKYYTNKPEVKSINDSVFGGIPVLEVVGGDNIGSPYKTIIAEHNSYLVIIMQNSSSKFLDTVLSTFKFITTAIEPTVDTSNLKTFHSTAFGYDFKYPSNYVVKEVDTTVQVYESANTNTQALVQFYGQKTDTPLNTIIQDKTDGRVLSDAKTTTINGIQAYEGVDQGIVNSYGAYLKNDSSFVQITFGKTDGDDLQQIKSKLTNNQKLILSTFKFN